MAKRDAAAVDVDLLGVEREVADAGDRLRRERFVELDEIDLIDRETCALERFLRRRNWPEAHAARIDTSHRGRNDARERLFGARADQEGRRSIVDSARAGCRDRAVLLERGLQLRDRFHRRAGAWILILRKRRAVGEGNRHQLVREYALLERPLGALLALHRKRILLGARDLVALCHDFRGLAERDRPFLFHARIHEAPTDGGIGRLGWFSAPRLARLERYVGGACNALDAARDERLPFARLDRLRGTGGGLESRAAQPIHRLPWHFDRQPGE